MKIWPVPYQNDWCESNQGIENDACYFKTSKVNHKIDSSFMMELSLY